MVWYNVDKPTKVVRHKDDCVWVRKWVYVHKGAQYKGIEEPRRDGAWWKYNPTNKTAINCKFCHNLN